MGKVSLAPSPPPQTIQKKFIPIRTRIFSTNTHAHTLASYVATIQ